ncbi:unnamed protein product, partial [Mesorhabditis spiculigera]
MCFSGLGQIVFGGIMVLCLALTAASMFSDGWRKYPDDQHSGIFGYNCVNPNITNGQTQKQICNEWWKNLKTWEKVTVIAMSLALVAELVCLAYNVFACFACCWKKYVIHPLSALAALVAIFLAIAVVVYGVNNKNAFDEVKDNFTNGQKITTQLGYSYFLAIAALILAVIDIFVAALTICLAESCI